MKIVPGPGNYNINDTIEKKGPVFGKSRRNNYESNEVIKVPGPGAYNDHEIAKKLASTPRYK